VWRYGFPEMDDERDTGDPAGLPPRAPAYDLRTGEALNAPGSARASGSGDDADFSLSELGIWAPSEDEAPASAEPTADADATAASRQPTPPPGRPGSVPGFAPPGPWAPGSPTPPPGYGPPGAGPTGAAPPGYGPPGYPPGYAPTAHQPSAPRPSRRGPLLLAGVVGVLVVVVAVLIAVLALGGSKKTPVALNPTGTPGTSTGAPSVSPSSSATSSGTGGDTGAAGAQVAFLRTVDGILTQSASGRQQVSSVVTGVQNGCSVTPEDASATIRQVLVNRQSVLGQANALTAPDAATATVKADLIRSLNASIEASRGYQRWLDNLYATYYNDDPVGCPDGQAPTDANFDAASAASGRATAAKQTFVAAYDPLASSAGLRTWQESEF
jgi:hypothetical protein